MYGQGFFFITLSSTCRYIYMNPVIIASGDYVHVYVFRRKHIYIYPSSSALPTYPTYTLLLLTTHFDPGETHSQERPRYRYMC